MPGHAFEARIYANKSSKSITKSWTLPLWFLPLKSPYVTREGPSSPLNDKNLLLSKRVAKQLGINDGSIINLDIPVFQASLSLQVSLVDDSNTMSDLTLNDAFTIGENGDTTNPKLIEQLDMSSVDNLGYVTPTGLNITVPVQHLLSPYTSQEYSPSPPTNGILFFGGRTSRHKSNNNGPAGYGYCITTESGEELIKGYGYMSGKRSNNYMEYAGLIEGLNWALRFYFHELDIRGDSELILKQVFGKYSVDNPRLKECFDQVKGLMKGDQGEDVKYTWTKISRKDNRVVDTLTNLAMDRMENKTDVNWVNVNK